MEEGEEAGENSPSNFIFRKEEEEEEEEVSEIREDMVEEMMRWLEREIMTEGAPASIGGGGFVTINGNEESCGPSFSDAASTVMASIDTRGVPSGASHFWPMAEQAEASSGSLFRWEWDVVAPEGYFKEEEKNGDDAKEAVTEEWLACVLDEASRGHDTALLV